MPTIIERLTTAVTSAETSAATLVSQVGALAVVVATTAASAAAALASQNAAATSAAAALASQGAAAVSAAAALASQGAAATSETNAATSAATATTQAGNASTSAAAALASQNAAATSATNAAGSATAAAGSATAAEGSATAAAASATAAAGYVVPSQTGNGGKVLMTNGAAVSWATAADLVSINSITSAAATNFTLTANAGTSLVLGNGATGGFTFTAGTGASQWTANPPAGTSLLTMVSSGGAAGLKLQSANATGGNSYVQTTASGVADWSAGVLRSDGLWRVNTGASLNGTDTITSSSTVVKVPLATASTNTTTGAFQVAGGVGIAGDVNIGGNLSAGQLVFTSTGAGSNLYLRANGAGFVRIDTGSGFRLEAGTLNITSSGTHTLSSASGLLTIAGTTASTSTTTGAFQVVGGVGIGGALWTGGKVVAIGDPGGSYAFGAYSSANSTFSAFNGKNDNGGTSANIGATINNGAYTIGFEMPGQSYTTNGPRVANRGYVFSDGAQGLTLHAVNNIVRFWAGNPGTEMATVSTTNIDLLTRVQLCHNATISLAAWGLNGVNTYGANAAYTDTSSAGTVASGALHVFQSGSWAATSATTYSDAAVAYFQAPNTGTNVSFTRTYSIWSAGVIRSDVKLAMASTNNNANQGIQFGDITLGGDAWLYRSATGTLTMSATTASTSTTTGTLVLSGGLGIAGATYHGNQVRIATTNTGNNNVLGLYASDGTTLYGLFGAVGTAGTLSTNSAGLDVVIRSQAALRLTSGGATERIILTSLGSIVLGVAALATNATDGFLYMPSCAGTPTGVPTAQTGTVAHLYDTTANKLWVYNGAWKSVALA